MDPVAGFVSFLPLFVEELSVLRGVSWLMFL